MYTFPNKKMRMELVWLALSTPTGKGLDIDANDISSKTQTFWVRFAFGFTNPLDDKTNWKRGHSSETHLKMLLPTCIR